MKPWEKIKWQKSNIGLANRPFADLFWDADELCVRCGRPHTLDSAKHTRLYGYMCVCGSQEWARPNDRHQPPAADGGSSTAGDSTAAGG